MWGKASLAGEERKTIGQTQDKEEELQTRATNGLYQAPQRLSPKGGGNVVTSHHFSCGNHSRSGDCLCREPIKEQ